MSSTSFPLEIEEAIIDILADDDEGYSALKSCSLVCKAFLPICRKHIFNSIAINHESTNAAPSQTCQAIQRLLLGSPEIADYIRKLVFCIKKSDIDNPWIFEPLKRISRLESLHIISPRKPVFDLIDWSDNPLRSTILHLLHLPTITHFKVASMRNFVVSDLIPCVNLRSLDFSDGIVLAPSTTFSADFTKQSIQLNELLAGSLTATALLIQFAHGKLVIDFSFLSKITIELDEPDDGPTAQKLFAHFKTLTDVNISFFKPMAVSLADMLRPSLRTLRMLAVTFIVENEDDDPLFGLDSELEAMRAENIIESITIDIMVQTDENCSCGDEWGRLDQVLSRPGWPSLKKVSLEIKVVSYSRVPGTNELEVALRKLPETQFRQISSSQAVSFKFNVSSYLI